MPDSNDAPPHLGSAFILAGTAIGAGMLALPVVSAQIGFLSMLVIFVVIAFFMTYSALLMLEANLAIGKGSSLYTMAATVLGRPGKVLAILAPLGLFYSLMGAYLAGGGGLVHQLAGDALDISLQTSVLIFTLVAGLIVYCSTKVVDYVNRVLFLLMLVAFFAAILSLIPGIQYTNLNVSKSLSAGYFWVAIPVVFTSFGYHGSIPSVILYQKQNVSQLPKALILGTVIALLFYVVWLFVAMGNLSEHSFDKINSSGGSVGELINQLALVSGTRTYLETFLFIFSDLALLTSTLGVALGLFDYLASLFQRRDSFAGRFQTSVLTFCPPALFALFYPDGFIVALGYAAIALSVLAVLLPAAIAWILRRRRLSSLSYRAPGGNRLLVCSILFGFFIISAQVLAVWGASS